MSLLRTLFRRLFGSGSRFIAHPERLALSGAVRAATTHTLERD